MERGQWERLKELFEAARTLDGAERERYLETACAGDQALRAELESLLAAEADAGGFLEGAATAVLLRDLGEHAPVPVGRRFGPYRVVSEIGRGGMGVVYRAVRDDDAFHKEVALKVLHTGLESAYLEKRFRRERQILATLDHPNIARLLDGGSDESGRLFCVLELVEGMHIDAYCREHAPGVAARLELIRTVCGAVALAHSRLVAHCDLKPANVLVTPDGTVKLLDFGIAKLLAPDTASQAPAATATGWWMTPQYASPEQVRGEPVSTATDVYAIGVILFELLTGRTPYDLGSRSPDEVVRAICEQEVGRPSQAVTRPLPAGAARSAAISSTAGPPDVNRRRLRRRLTGDLDTIVLRALAKDPARRYSSVGHLAEDLRRHLAGLPIRARPDHLAYRARKFVGRHRTAVAAALLLLATLFGGLIATVQQARRARAQRAVAERRFEQVRRLAGTFIFEVHDLVAGLPGSTPVRKRIVELGLEYLEQLEGDAQDDAALQEELAAGYERIAAVQGGVGVANLGDPAGAIASQRRALVLREAVARAGPGELGAQLALARAHSTLGDLLGAAGDRDGRVRQYEAARAIRDTAAERAPDDPAVRRAVASGLWDEAQVRVDDGDLTGGLASFEKVRELYRRLAETDGTSDGDRRNLALAAKKVGAIRSVVGDSAGALESLEEALAIDEARLAAAPAHPEMLLDVSFDRADLGYVLLKLGRAREAVAHYEEALALREAVATADPGDVRARGALRSARVRLAGALGALVGTEDLPCREVRDHLDRALALWAEAEADGPLEKTATAERRQLLAMAARCRTASPSP